MKKYFLAFLVSISLFGGLVVPVLAQTEPDLSVQVAEKSGYGQNGAPNISETVGRIIRIILGLLGTIFLGLTVYAGVLWMTAAGDEEKVTKSMGIIRMAVIGLIVILASYSLSYFVLDKIFEATL